MPSRFLFDERLFDPAYFAEKMRESRERQKERKEAIKTKLQNARSGAIFPNEPPDGSALENFQGELTQFLGSAISPPPPREKPLFDLRAYRAQVLEAAQGCNRRFEAFLPVLADERLDRIFRFITLIYLWHEGLVHIRQESGTIWVIG